MIDTDQTEKNYDDALKKVQATAEQLRSDICQPATRQLDRHIKFVQRWADYCVALEDAKQRIADARNSVKEALL